VLDEVLSEAATGGVVIVPPLKPKVEAKLDKSLALSTLYAMLARHGWQPGSTQYVQIIHEASTPAYFHPIINPSELFKRNLL